jgi:MraZ protein
VFVGEFERSVDGNGRLTLPAEFRDKLGASCYLTGHPKGFVSVSTVDDFERKAAELLEKAARGEVTEAAVRKMGRNSSIVAIDKSSRITLDEASRQRAGIEAGSQVILVGALDRLEIWRPSRFDTVTDEDDVTEPDRVWVDA